MPAKKKTHGGAGRGQGRKPSGSARIQKTIYVNPDILAKIPGSVGQWIESDPRLRADYRGD